jgi:NAD-dependent dihydropyrimidine dehydrogenase PreA subunit
MHIDIDNDLCVGCGFCALICPQLVLSLSGGYVATVVNPGRCNLCMDCEKECPEGAIKVEDIYKFVS